MIPDPAPPAEPLALYVHWPFCAAKCPYCDFNSHVAPRVDHEGWRRALVAEIARMRAETGPRPLSSVFFGGGTPSLMEPETVEAVLEAARAAWGFRNDVEITMEANPASADAGRFRAYAAAGVGRLSLGVQALDDRALRALGRLHGADEARAALRLAREVFGRVSLDLIYARQDQTPEAWAAELAEALRLADGHLSLYALTIEDGTAFGARWRAGRLRGLPDEDRAVALWEVTQRLTEAAGLPAYEISNHARPGEESRHNLTYWRGGDWVGIGPGAHGRLTLGGRRWATEAVRAPGAWLAAVAGRGSGEAAREALPPREAAEERLMMGLRLAEGVEEAALGPLGDLEARLGPLEAEGLLVREGGRLRATERGRPLLDALLRAILA
ncbi:radical SAM family heme chaperone HemW [Rubellimicrobium sp. CFH 75288]|uniref:radical SAM family heme chaperone HemW n=1 Tax=Rubellimicrobium sp. CFH 75288 TaxID=2697034 RepID=UPI001411CFFA|nr:radical SAM family heme chaperone HemW [Rubellimicrobium sp. CFH 75288]NAZ37764.1 coproporphyrinogen III oxidase [Rubellimicrobium sp. CFH 75288]